VSICVNDRFVLRKDSDATLRATKVSAQRRVVARGLGQALLAAAHFEKEPERYARSQNEQDNHFVPPTVLAPGRVRENF